MTTMAEEGDVDFEEGMLWLPAHVLEEACEPKEQEILQRRQQQQQQHHLTTLHTSAGPFPPHSISKLSPKLHQRTRYPTYRASGGPGMQAIFLDSGSQRSCGTGVFLPRMGGINFQQSKKQPVCSPVLLPSRVVQALNLNVHKLGSQLTSQRDLKNNTNKGGIQDSLSNKNGSSNDVNGHGHGVSATQCCVYSQACSCSPEIFLPKEWSY